MSEFNLSQYELQDFATLEIQNKKGDGPLLGADDKPVTIDVWSPGSDAAVEWESKLNRELTNRAMRTARGKPQDLDARRDFAAKLTAHTKAIHNFPVTPEALYGNPRLGYIADQVARFMGDSANF